MKGSIRQRGKQSWQLRYDVGLDPATGERRTHQITVRGSRRDAERKLRETLTALDAGRYVEPTKITIAEHCRARIQQWEDAGDITAKTAERYREWLKFAIAPYLGHKAFQALTVIDIEAWHTILRTKRQFKPRSVGHAHRILRKALGDAVRFGLLSKNVCGRDGQRAPKVPVAEVAIIPADQIDDVVAKLRGRAIYCKAVTLLFTGLRRSELMALRWCDVDLDAKMLAVRGAVEETRTHGLRVKPTKTAASRRDVSLPDIVVEALAEHRREQLEWRMRTGLGRLPTDGWVFAGRAGGLASPRNLTGDWAEAIDALGLPKVTLHALRHTHASQLIDAKVDIVRIAKRLGHASPEITLRVYGHMFVANDREAADVINAALGQPRTR
jgi:integrase